MAIIFKRKTRAGKAAKNWSIKYKNASGEWITIAGLATKELSRQKALDLEQRVLDVQAGRIDPFEAPKASPLKEHVQAFKRELEARGRSKDHIAPTIKRIESIFEGCGFETITDLISFDVADEVNRYLATRSELSAATVNKYRGAVKAFCRWAVHRMPASPLLMIGNASTEGEETRERRALTTKQFNDLIKVANAGQTTKRLTGEDRAWLYMIAAYSGLRASELASLTPGSFCLDGGAPYIMVRAAYTKNRKEARQPIRPDFAKMLGRWLTGKSGPLWPGKWYRRAADMLRTDLNAAGIPFETAEGVVDFHALRVTYVTSLARAGVHPSIAQRLARHSVITLTMGTYTKLSKAEISEGLQGLPAPAKSWPERPHGARTKCAPNFSSAPVIRGSLSTLVAVEGIDRNR